MSLLACLLERQRVLPPNVSMLQSLSISLCRCTGEQLVPSLTSRCSRMNCCFQSLERWSFSVCFCVFVYVRMSFISTPHTTSFTLHNAFQCIILSHSPPITPHLPIHLSSHLTSQPLNPSPPTTDQTASSLTPHLPIHHPHPHLPTSEPLSSHYRSDCLIPHPSPSHPSPSPSPPNL